MAFLSLECKEAFYGGACGGGKSDALLMWALEGVDTPGYTAILFRRTFPELRQSGGFIPRSHEWLAKTDARWNGSEHTWTFPSGARLTFGAMQHTKDKYKYQGGEFIRAGFDELTHFNEEQFQWITTRLRRIKGFPWRPQIRSGANPGGEGHLWVKNRYVTQEAIDSIRDGHASVHWNGKKAFVPARLDDNKHLEQEEYRETLSELPPVLRERLLMGDWSVVEDALIKEEWLRYYQTNGEHLQSLDADLNVLAGGTIDQRELTRFATVDTAGTSKQKAEEKRGKPASWSVMAVWDYWPTQKKLFLRHVWRDRVGFTDLCAGIKKTSDEWKPGKVHIENAHLGPAVYDNLKGKAPVALINTVTAFMKGKDGMPGKVERATPLFNKLDRGEIYLPLANADWLPTLEAEWLAWTGLPEEPADQIDVASYAATIVYDWRSTRISRNDFGVSRLPAWGTG